MTLLRSLRLGLVALAIAACGGYEPGEAERAGTLRVRIADAPPAPAYAQAWITVDAVRFHAGDTAADAAPGWQELRPRPARRIDLLASRDGRRTDLGELRVPAGTYRQVRLVLGDRAGDHELVLADGSRHVLTTPAVELGGVELAAPPFEVVAGETTDVVIDVDAARSIARAVDSGVYRFRPVARVVSMRDAGSLAGTFSDAAAADGAMVSLQSYEVATGRVGVLRSTTPAGDGRWTLAPVPAGVDYLLVVTRPGYRTLVLTDLDVGTGASIDVGALALAPVRIGLGSSPAQPTMRTAAGGVVPPAEAQVRAMQRVVDTADPAGDRRVEIAFAQADLDTGAFGFELTVEPAQVGPSMAALAQGAHAGVFDFVADGPLGSGTLSGVDLNPASATSLAIPIVP